MDLKVYHSTSPIFFLTPICVSMLIIDNNNYIFITVKKKRKKINSIITEILIFMT